MRKNIKLINNLNIFIIIILLNFNLSCSKEKKKVKKFELNKDIEFKINDFENKTPQETINDDKNLFYLFSNKKDKIIYNVKSLQLLTSTYSQVLITINFNINLKIIKPEIDKKSKKLPKKEESINTFNYKIYFTNFKLEHKIIYGHVNFEAIEKKYHLLIN